MKRNSYYSGRSHFAPLRNNGKIYVFEDVWKHAVSEGINWLVQSSRKATYSCESDLKWAFPLPLQLHICIFIL